MGRFHTMFSVLAAAIGSGEALRAADDNSHEYIPAPGAPYGAMPRLRRGRSDPERRTRYLRRRAVVHGKPESASLKAWREARRKESPDAR